MTMHTRSIHVRIPMAIPALLACLAVAGCSAAVDNPSESVASATEALSCSSPIPAALQVPDGNRLAFAFKGVGAQIYACQASADGTTQSWVFQAPDADLIGPGGRIVGSHYKGPTWEALDGSTVVGTKLAGVTVDATAIPWLLLQGTSHTGTGLMSGVTYIQRLNTTGGLAPTSGCDAGHVGAVANVDYTAIYAFYAASHGPKH
jgi:hypothetical protein